MFDARSILDILIGGEPRRQGGQPGSSVFKDMLDQLGGPPSQPASGSTPNTRPLPQPTPAPPSAAPQGQHSLKELLSEIVRQFQAGQARQAPSPSRGDGPVTPEPQQEVGGGMEVGRELQDLLRQILAGRTAPTGGTETPVSRVMSDGGAGKPGEGGEQVGLGEALRQILGQAVAGAREGASKIDEVTGISGKARDALVEATGQTPEELVARLRTLIAENKLATGAALGGLGALLLGTRTGRSLAATGIKLGGLALIGGLAYKAYQNYQQGKPPLAAETETRATPPSQLPAPSGTGFEEDAVSQDAARRCIRAMIAAAAADGQIDSEEQQRIVDGLQQAGIDDAARQFLTAEIRSPASAAELASGVSSPEEALQVYTAARIAIDPDTAKEHAFLSSLAEALGIDPALARQVDAATRGAASAPSV